MKETFSAKMISFSASKNDFYSYRAAVTAFLVASLI